VGIIDVERPDQGIARVVMKHEFARNAMGEELRGALLAVLPELVADEQTRVIMIASGLKDFSVGGDLSKMDELSDPKAGRQRMLSAHRLARLLLSIDKPLIAEVRGHAVGAGAGLALVCDTIVMGETASIGFPFLRVGLAPDFAIAHTLPRRIGFAKARQALLYARSFKGPEALALGMVDEVVTDDTVSATALERAHELASLPALAASLTKRMMENSDDPVAVLDFEAMAQPICFASDDFREGLSAFREKRKPRFGSPAR
jgi:2-(1,2-epoxy-1,2-dihydrophenyl)acetyl-CoA isomerase